MLAITFMNGAKLSFALPILLWSAQPALSAGFSGASFNVSGVETTLVDASLVQFNLTLLQFAAARPGSNDSIIEFTTSGDKEIFQFIARGGPIDDDHLNLRVKGEFGETLTQGGTTRVSNPWWKFDFTFNLKDREASEGNLIWLDEISVANGIIQHLEDPHAGDAEEGLELVWGDLSLIANATKVDANGIRRTSLPPPLDCERHPGLDHIDCITEGKLSGKVINNNLGDDFENWRLEAKAVHKVPGPLPILGIGAAFHYSRRLRYRLKRIN
jgi:hypothetical protein